MVYDFDTENMLEWSWLEMVAQLSDESMRFVVLGPECRSHGLVGCEVAPRPNSCERLMHDRLNSTLGPEWDKISQPQLRIWDFVLKRADGSAVRLHPQWSTPKVETYFAEGVKTTV